MADIKTPTIKKIYKMTEFDLLRTKVTMGNMYMCVDTQKLYYDGGNTADTRQVYNYISVRTVNDLMYNITPDFGKSYYCWEDNSLWIWLNKWQTLYANTTYPSAYVYDDIPTTSSQQGITEIYRYDMPNYPADDNGLLKDGSVVVRDRQRIIKGRIYVDDGNDNLIISSFLGGGLRFLPNGKMSTEGELLIGDNGKSTLRSSLSLIDNEMYIDYSESPEKDTSEYASSTHIYKVYHEGNLDVSAIKVMTPEQVYNKLLVKDELPEIFDFNVAQLGGYSASDLALANHTHITSDITDIYSEIEKQSGLAVRNIFNSMEGIGISGSYNTATQTLSLEVNNFTLSLTGGVSGRATITGLTNTVMEVAVDADKHSHTKYEQQLASLQNQIDIINIDTSVTYTRDVIDTKIAEVTATDVPTAGKPLKVNGSGILPGIVTNAKQLDHTITINLVGNVSGSTTFNGSETEINLDANVDLEGGAVGEALDEKLASKCYKAIFGNGVDSIYTIRHNLASEHLIVQFRDLTTKQQVYLSNTLLDENIIQIESANIIDTDSMEIVIYNLA